MTERTEGRPDVTVHPEEIDRRVEAAESALRDVGLRITRQRRETVSAIVATDEHPDVEAVFKRVRQRIPGVSLDTVYRTLATLADLGVIDRLSGVPGAVRYDPKTPRHHHFACARCRRVVDVEGSELDAVRTPAGVADLGRVESVEVQFRGVCRACVEAETAGS